MKDTFRRRIITEKTKPYKLYEFDRIIDRKEKYIYSRDSFNNIPDSVYVTLGRPKTDAPRLSSIIGNAKLEVTDKGIFVKRDKIQFYDSEKSVRAKILLNAGYNLYSFATGIMDGHKVKDCNIFCIFISKNSRYIDSSL